MRYEIRHTNLVTWEVLDTSTPADPVITRRCTEAQAQIIAWALNQVADGGLLRAVFWGDEYRWVQYAGPAEM